jgi:small subunit ribosomal protein S16
MGKKKQPMYKIVVADARSPRDGKFIEAVGFYNPLVNPHLIQLNEEKINLWLNRGAIPTLTVKSILSQNGILLKRHLEKKKFSEEKIEAELANWQKIKEAKLSQPKTRKKKSKKSKAEGNN